MLVKIICKNIDRQNMLLYALSIILSIVLDTFFLTALLVNAQYGLDEKAGSMDWLCTMFFLIAGAVSVCFTLYSTGYYVRTKNRDYSLLMMLGGSRKMIFGFFSLEFVLIYVFSVVSGLVTGGILSVLFLGVLRVWGYAVGFSLSDVLWVAANVVQVSLGLFVVEYLAVLIYFSKKDLSVIQTRGVKKEGRHERTFFLVIGGIGLIVGAMILLRRKDMLHEMISIAVCLIGVYTILSFGGSLILMILRAYKNFYYENMIVLNEFYYKFKSNCRLLYMMFVLDFVVLFFTGGCVISQTQEDVDSAEYPYGFVGVIQDSERAEIETYRGLLGSDCTALSAVEGMVDIQGYNQTYLCISDSDYSRLTARDVCLEETEAILVNESTILDLKKPDVLYLNENNLGENDFSAMRANALGMRELTAGADNDAGQADKHSCVLTIVEVCNEIVFGMEKPDCLRAFVILPESVIAEYEGNHYTIIVKKGNLQKEYEQYKSSMLETDADIFWRCAFLEDANENMAFVKIISVFAGIFCLISSFALFALKVQGDLPMLNQKYGLLYQLGMSENAIAKAISAEYRNMLAIPIVLSILLSSIYMYAEATGWDNGVWAYLCRYIPFQIVFLVLISVLIFAYFTKLRKRFAKELSMNSFLAGAE